MILQPFFSYFGSKWRLAVHYPVPRFSSIVEPFAGSAGYCLHHPSAKVHLVDKNPVVVGIWRYLLAVSEAEILAIPDVPAGGSIDDLPRGLPEEARWLVGFWLQRGGVRPMSGTSGWFSKVPHHPSFWGANIRERIARQLSAIRHWTVAQGDYDSVDPQKATWFVDPPYQGPGSRYPCSARSIDYGHLGLWCRALPGQVIVCEQEGASWLPFRPCSDVRSVNGKVTREVIWTNDPPRHEQMSLFADK